MAGQRGISLPNFSALDQFVDPLAGFGKYAQQKGDQIRADEKYAAEKARQDLLFAQQQEDRAQAKQIRADTLGTQQALTMAAPHVGQVVAFEDPRYAEALKAYVGDKGTVVNGSFLPTKEGGPAVDITDSEKILADYVAKTPVPVTPSAQYESILGASPVTSTDAQGSLLKATSTSSPVGVSRTVTTGGNPIFNKEGYVDPKATVSFGESTPGITAGTKTRNEFELGVWPMSKYKPVLESGVVPGTKTPKFISNITSNAKTLFESPMALSKFMQNTVDVNNKPVADAKTVLSKPQEYTKEAIKSALLETPGMYTNRPASSVRELNVKGKSVLEEYGTSRSGTQANYTTKITDIDTSKMYNKDRTLIDSKKRATSKTGDVFFRSNDGKMVNALTLGKAMQENYVPANSVVVGRTPIQERVVSSSAVEISQGAPVFKTSEQHVKSIAKANGIPEAQVVSTMNGVGDSYKSILAMLGTDNTKERDVLSKMAQSQAAQSGLTLQEFNPKDYVDSVLPKNDLTQRQVMAVNSALKQLDDIRQDKRWAKEDQYKDMVFKHQVAMDTISNQFKAAGLSLDKQRVGLAAKELSLKGTSAKVDMSNTLVKSPTGEIAFMPKTAVLPKGYTIVDTSSKDSGKSIDITAFGNQRKISDWVANAKAQGWKTHEINAALQNAPKGDSILDFGSPDLDLTYANKYLQGVDR